ncbi:MAG: lspA [Candidatus Midichloriaceae bacterium]|jgi:signal peptidase II|nr:lspA [Candidatus Midichloriaceae bacterium]
MLRLVSFLTTNKKPLGFSLCFILALKVIFLDQVTKLAVLEYFAVHSDSIRVFSLLNIVKVYNKGISFGLFNSAQNANIILAITSSLIICGLWFWFASNISYLNGFAVGLITGGAIGNLIDRALYHAVVDFIDFHIGGWHYPAFNVADGSIVLGVIVLAIITWKN